MNDREPVLEYACHEGNYALRNMLSGERATEREPARNRRRKARGSWPLRHVRVFELLISDRANM